MRTLKALLPLIAALPLVLLMALAAVGGVTVHVDASAPPGGDGSEAHPFDTIQEGIIAAGDTDTVLVQQGLYVERIDFVGKAITVTSTDPENPAVVAATIIDGNDAGPVVSFVNGETREAVIQGFTITGGVGGSYYTKGGGGIKCQASSPTIRLNLITDNTGAWGAGVGCYHGWPLIEDNIISTNQGGTCGGGIAVAASEEMAQATVIRDNVISGNTVAGGFGGGGIGYYAYYGGVWLEIEGNTITDNEVTNGEGGGGIGGRMAASESRLTICDNTVSGNRIPCDSGVASGAGVWCPTASLLLENNTISGNTATSADSGGYMGYGGGVYCRGSSIEIRGNVISDNVNLAAGGIYCSGESVVIEGNAVTGNCATDGFPGGLYCNRYSDTGAPVIIRHNVISGNSAWRAYQWGGGGGIWAWDVSLIVENNLIADNDAGNLGGGGVCFVAAHHDATLLLHSNTIAGNTAYDGGGILCSEGATTGAVGIVEAVGNIIWGNSADNRGPQVYASYLSELAVDCCNIEGSLVGMYVPSTICLWGANNLSLDPLFADPAGGDYHLKSTVGRWDPAANGGDGAWVTDDVDSPCINTGDPAADFAEEPEPNGGRVNMGCYGSTAEASKGPPAIEVTAAVDYDWCYQNAPLTTQGRHKVTLTASVAADPYGNTAYTVSVMPVPAAAFTVEPTADPWVWELVAGRDGEDPKGPVIVHVMLEGTDVGGHGLATVLVTARPIGDIDGSGYVNATDKAHMNAWLNGVPLAGDTVRHVDLNGDGDVNAVDKVQVNRQLNGLGIL